MKKKYGDGQNYMRDFTADFTGTDIYIGGKSFPKGYFTVAALNYEEDVVEDILYTAQTILKMLTLLQNVYFDPDLFTETGTAVRKISKILSEHEPFCYLDTKEEQGLLEDIFIPATTTAFRAYFCVMGKLESLSNPTAADLSENEQLALEVGKALHRTVYDLLNSYHYFCHDICTFANAIYNLERLELQDLEQRNVASFAQTCHHFFSNEENMKELFLVQPFHGVAGFSLSSVTKMEIVVVPNPKKPGEMMFARRYGFRRLMDFLVSDFFEGLQAGHAPKQCEICKKYFLTTDGRHQRYCTGYAPNDPKHRTCQAVAARMGRKEREKAADHPVKAVCETRCNTIDHHLRSGKIDKEFAAAAKRIARNRKNRAISDNQYFLEQYNEEMTQEAIYAETERVLGRPPQPQKESL